MSKRPIYMDHAATSPLREEVLGNSPLQDSRQLSLHSLGRKRGRRLMKRAKQPGLSRPLRNFLHLRMTEANNIAIKGTRGGKVRAPDHFSKSTTLFLMSQGSRR